MKNDADDDFEIIDDDRPKRRRDDDDGRPRRRPSARDDDEDERPQKRKKKRRSSVLAGTTRKSSVGFCESLGIDYIIQTNVGAFLGVGLNLLGIFTHTPLLSVLGLPFWIWGCAAYAKNKGYSEWFGFLGLLSILGLIVLVCLPSQD